MGKVQNNQNWAFTIISNHYAGKRMKNRMERSKLDILNHFGQLWWEKIVKSAEQPKLSVLNDFIPLW